VTACQRHEAEVSIAKREEILYVLGREDDPVVLDHHSPVLHLIQQVRDEAHRFAVTFHRARYSRRTLTSELLEIPGIGEKTARKLLAHFGSLSVVKSLTLEELSQVVGTAQAKQIRDYASPTAEHN
jgi:excinuclease ABC subunit C